MAEEGQVIGCHTMEAWNEQLQKGNDCNKLVNLLVFFVWIYSLMSGYECGFGFWNQFLVLINMFCCFYVSEN